MATLDADVQSATSVISDLVAALVAASNPVSPVSQADQDALETAIAAGQAALAPPVETLTFDPATIDTALGQPASFSVGTVSGGTAPYTVTVTGLPDALVSDASGNVTGIPSATGVSSLSVGVADSSNPVQTTSGTVTLTVA